MQSHIRQCEKGKIEAREKQQKVIQYEKDFNDGNYSSVIGFLNDCKTSQREYRKTRKTRKKSTQKLRLQLDNNVVYNFSSLDVI